ncbi:hypothetical protein ACFSQT_34785 [Mesorhizobium calcicola]|uniref:Uncharacterized protein n=1 Tax=Mesorhizobium calcicola TaxID=1300310 RepID=A0ABW4WPN7_9HYPH
MYAEARLVQAGNAPNAAKTASMTAWDPWDAWRIARVYVPIATAVQELLAVTVQHIRAAEPVRILQIGGEPELLAAFLRQSGAVKGVAVADYDITHIDGDAQNLSNFGDPFTLAVALDWLPMFEPSRRQRAVAQLCQLARHGIILANAFDAPEINAAVRAVADTYQQVHNEDHPVLGSQLELGLPHLDLLLTWIAPYFANLISRPVESIALWQASESVAAVRGSHRGRLGATDAAAVAAFAKLFPVHHPQDGYWTLVAAAAQSLPESPAPQPDGRNEAASVALMHHLLEASVQRSAIDRLTEAVAVERKRDSDAFDATVASLAGQLRELDARAEFLAREVRARDQALADQGAAIAMETRIASSLAEQIREIEARAESQMHELRARAQALIDLQKSRAGRALALYTRLKQAVLRR